MKRIFIYFGAVVGVFVLGLIVGGRWTSGSGESGVAEGKPAQSEVWTCSMHPQFQLPKPGKCPICAMDLISAKAGGSSGGHDGRLQLSPTAMRLAQIETAPVSRRFPSVDVRMVGKVHYDETRVGYITSRVPGRLDKLYVDYTGVPVKEGEHVAFLFSPELLTAQEELMRAREMVSKLGTGGTEAARERAQATVDSAREKLRLWGVTATQVEAIEKQSAPTDQLTMYSPMSGVVVEKHAVEGMYVTTGTRIYTIADLSHLWVKLDAYESDLPWIRYGQEVEFETEAFPGELFTGKISFIDPVLDPVTRTVKVRVIVNNEEGRLKPEMFVRATIHSRIAGAGQVMDPGLAGKWISPMHPEIVKDGPGDCDICGMKLVTAESLGFASGTATATEPPLVIPASAPLITGRRAVVYVALTNQPGMFEGREIVLGTRAGPDYIVLQGLDEGETVVVNGAFKIDSAIQIQAGPSMMMPGRLNSGEQHAEAVHSTEQLQVSETFRGQLQTVYLRSVELQKALASDDVGKVRPLVRVILDGIETLDSGELDAHGRSHWKSVGIELSRSGSELLKAQGIAAIRSAFSPFSEALLGAVTLIGVDRPVFLVECPMALDGAGARWLTDTNEVFNPYYGATMLRCGEVLRELPPVNPVDPESVEPDADGGNQ